MSPTFDKVSPLTCVIDVECVSKEILNFTENGIVSADGKEREFDIIVCATGFDVAFAPHLYAAYLFAHGLCLEEVLTRTILARLLAATAYP